jgi:hypothetical protein
MATGIDYTVGDIEKAGLMFGAHVNLQHVLQIGSA